VLLARQAQARDSFFVVLRVHSFGSLWPPRWRRFRTSEAGDPWPNL
jgi:hypothetical protein